MQLTRPEAKVYPPARLGWAMWGLGGILYLISFYQRVAPAVMADELMRDFALTAAGLGNLSAFYFYSYVAMQIPTGILADRLGPRRLMAGGALIAAVGTLIFAYAPTVWAANLGRFLIGGSTAVAFVASLQIAGNWLPPRQFALASGMLLLVGVIGAITAGVPLQLAIDAYDWRSVMAASALLPLLAAVAIWLFVRDRPESLGYDPFLAATSTSERRVGVWEGIRKVLGYRNGLLLFLIPPGISGASLSFAGLWGVPFLTTHYGLAEASAAAITTALMIAFALSGPIMGSLSDRIGRRKVIYLSGCALALMGWAFLVYVPGLPVWLFTAVLVVTAAASGTLVIGFAFARESVPRQLAGTAVGIANTGVMLGPMVLQPAIGWVLDRQWAGEMAGDGRVYSLGAYQAAFSLMVGWIALSLVLLTLTQETYCRPLGNQSL